ncbi:hypothetical protein CDL15_Pgr014715 [Punica granatum]|uniref:Uncharacterized protein n=1 Tax=Punica granatum TaxID=22663 RepID=A0A218Y1I4_PUNGR|nr:hypothetical protein CDL15_Pgr014715 [Punica granatum]
MGSSSSSSVDVCRVVVIVLLCLEVLVVLPGNVSAVRRADLVLANEEHLVRRSLMVASVPELVNEKQSFAHAPSMGAFFDPNQSNKRGVPKGSDPIHNRC